MPRVGGIVTSVLGLLLGAAVLGGLTFLVNNDGALDRIQTQLDDLRGDVPTPAEVRSQLPGQ